MVGRSVDWLLKNSPSPKKVLVLLRQTARQFPAFTRYKLLGASQRPRPPRTTRPPPRPAPPRTSSPPPTGPAPSGRAARPRSPATQPSAGSELPPSARMAVWADARTTAASMSARAARRLRGAVRPVPGRSRPYSQLSLWRAASTCRAAPPSRPSCSTAKGTTAGPYRDALSRSPALAAAPGAPATSPSPLANGERTVTSMRKRRSRGGNEGERGNEYEGEERKDPRQEETRYMHESEKSATW